MSKSLTERMVTVPWVSGLLSGLGWGLFVGFLLGKL